MLLSIWNFSGKCVLFSMATFSKFVFLIGYCYLVDGSTSLKKKPLILRQDVSFLMVSKKDAMFDLQNVYLVMAILWFVVYNGGFFQRILVFPINSEIIWDRNIYIQHKFWVIFTFTCCSLHLAPFQKGSVSRWDENVTVCWHISRICRNSGIISVFIRRPP